MTASPLVSTDWLAAHLFDADLRIVDGSWYLPSMARDPDAEFLAAHIPGAVRFNPDLIADTSIALPHMLAAPEVFAEAVGGLGISETDTIVVYDGMGLMSAARVWWNFLVMGAKKVFVLDGGLPKWVAEGRVLGAGATAPRPASFHARFDPTGVADAARVLAALDDPAIQVVDVRSAGRFRGEEPEPRPGLRGGHMPGARNLPFPDLIANGRLRDPAELRARFAAAGIDPARPVITSCGSGVTAPIVSLAMAAMGHRPATVYDGSWTEWGGRADLPVVTGR
ncbi:MAG: 3-mercaptopyruvate sulfurtransferase [Alphaproteobacteria bacterium]|nr:3-mercaptopyruvate sulfurtransferase [Alphaproteobacteria bacterium]